MRFDRNAPGNGVEAKYRLENGKAFLEWHFHLAGDCLAEQAPGLRRTGCGEIRLSLMAGEGNVAAQGMQIVGEEEPLETVLVQPRLWQGIKDPFMYDVEAELTVHGICLDRVRTRLCLRQAAAGGAGEISLNGQLLEVKAVEYCLPEAGPEEQRRRQALSDLRQLLRLGANSICMERKDHEPFLAGLCDRFGFLAFEKDDGEDQGLICAWDRAVKVRRREGSEGERIPAYRKEKDGLFLPCSQCPTALYYRYKARWSGEPFVYLVPESVRRLRSGNYAVTCYSSCGRVALYTDGEFFEFGKGEGEFTFQEIPARTPCIMLSAEGDGCSSALSVHKSFVKLQERN